MVGKDDGETMTGLLVAILGGLGCLCRYQIGRWLAPAAEGFPWATFVVNVAGCIAIGLVMGLALDQAKDGFWMRYQLPIVTGFLGGFTTYSAFGYETVRLWQAGHTATTLSYVTATMVLGGLGCALGLLIAKAFS